MPLHLLKAYATFAISSDGKVGEPAVLFEVGSAVIWFPSLDCQIITRPGTEEQEREAHIERHLILTVRAGGCVEVDTCKPANGDWRRRTAKK